MRIHGPTALFFAIVTVTSAVSVLLAVYAWDTPVEFSARDCLNLIWSAVAMVIAFTSLICCIELPRRRKADRRGGSKSVCSACE